MLYLYTLVQSFGARLHREERGATMVEYGLLVALIAIVVMAALITLGPAIKDLFTKVETEITK